ncbi:21516_t:CDS:2 [Entrophospora sp. SA101]|nr:21516_t:CDS:2 [Entrophospora sp. SA101]
MQPNNFLASIPNEQQVNGLDVDEFLNDWHGAVGYNYLLESLYDKDKIEKEANRNEHLPKLNDILKKQGIGEAKSYDALNDNGCFPNNPIWFNLSWICLLISQFEDTEDDFMLKKYHIKDDKGDIERRQTSHIISFLKDPSDVNGPNHDIILYFSKRPSHYKYPMI